MFTRDAFEKLAISAHDKGEDPVSNIHVMVAQGIMKVSRAKKKLVQELEKSEKS